MKNCSGLFWIQSSFIYLFHVSPQATRVRRCLSRLLKLTVLYITDLFYHSEHASYIPKKCDVIKSVRYVARIVVTCNSLIWKWAPKLSTHMSFSSSTLACDTVQIGYQVSNLTFTFHQKLTWYKTYSTSNKNIYFCKSVSWSRTVAVQKESWVKPHLNHI